MTTQKKFPTEKQRIKSLQKYAKSQRVNVMSVSGSEYRKSLEAGTDGNYYVIKNERKVLVTKSFAKAYKKYYSI